jgi:glutamyl-tRNA reductase
VSADDRLVAFLWHQRGAPLDTRERVLASLPGGTDRVLLETCHRVELYAVMPQDLPATAFLATSTQLGASELASMRIAEHASAARHLFSVAAGLDSAVAGEAQILRQVRRAYGGAAAPHPMLARLFERALHVGRTVRHESGFTNDRSVGSLAVDEVVRALADPASGTVLVVGAGEMGKLAVRALRRRVRRVIVANRDVSRASAISDAEHIEAVSLRDVPSALAASDAVISAADTRGAVITSELLRARLGSGPLVVVDVAVPRSVTVEGRLLKGLVYRSVDDLPGAAASAPAATLQSAAARCGLEADRFFRESGVERVRAIVALRTRGDDIRRRKLARALRRLGHLTPRDRRIVEALSTTLTDALLHPPTVALRRGHTSPEIAHAFFDAPPGTRP